MLTNSKLDFWIKYNYNILLIGKKGVGKSSIVIDAFNRNKLKWKYFSASTMDPWVDFIGVPKEKTEGGRTYLELIRPKDFQDDEVEALFFDEFNRSHKKIRNAVMELIQFKSINGKKYNNLRIVWAAINPDDDESESYDVERLDPAQMDRFHMHINMVYTPSYEFFREKYGAEDAHAATSWWKELPEDIKNLVSPRRLDYALDVYRNNGDICDVLHVKSNPTKLRRVLKNGPAKEKLKKFFNLKDSINSEIFLSNENNFADCIDYILKNKDYMEFFIPIMGKEKIASLIGKIPTDKRNLPTLKVLMNKYGTNDKIKSVVDSMIASQSNHRIKDELKKMLPEIKGNEEDGVVKNIFPFVEKVNKIKKLNSFNTFDRKHQFRELVKITPSKFSSVFEVLLALDIYDDILGRTQATTLKGNTYAYNYTKQSKQSKQSIIEYINIFSMINRCIDEISRIDNIDYKNILDKYAVVSRINNRLKRLGLDSKINKDVRLQIDDL